MKKFLLAGGIVALVFFVCVGILSQRDSDEQAEFEPPQTEPVLTEEEIATDRYGGLDRGAWTGTGRGNDKRGGRRSV